MAINIRERAQAVFDALEKLQHDPLVELVKMAKDSGTPPEDKLAINKELLQYIAPKLKAVDLTGALEFDGNIKVVSFKDVKAEDLEDHSR